LNQFPISITAKRKLRGHCSQYLWRNSNEYSTIEIPEAAGCWGQRL